MLGPVLDVLIATMPRDNLLSSGALELFEFIKKENVTDLVKHLVVNHRAKLLSLSYMPTFRELLLRYDQTNGYTANMDYFLDNEEDVESRRLPSNARMIEHIADPSEEEYWNTSDPEEDEDHNGKLAEKTPAANSASTPSKPLVDYSSDEENDENANDGLSSPTSNTNSGLSGTPPERVSEKRRREEDEEDDLGKLLQQNKRRNSSSASSNASNASMSPQIRTQRRKSFSSGTGNGTPKKIAISLSPAVKTGGSRSDEDP